MSKTEIKILLLRAGVSQAHFARQLGVSKAAIHNVIAGRSTSNRIKRAISKKLGIPVVDLWPSEKQAA